MLGLDIGGANLKVANGVGFARSVPFPLWRDRDGLPRALAQLIAAAPPTPNFAVTMTGELCDCFATKREGVRYILRVVREIAASKETRVFTVDGSFVSIEDAMENPIRAAASNWRALATFACRFLDRQAGLLIDIGSTTTDIVPLTPSGPTPVALDDTARLEAGELVYSGIERTPLCALLSSAPFRGKQIPVAAEVFATTGDAYRTLELTVEDPADFDTADGRPRTRSHAQSRLARMVCVDPADFTSNDATAMAKRVLDAHLTRLAVSARAVIARMAQPPATILVSGGGEFLARRVASDVAAGENTLSLSAQFGDHVSACAPAHAVAVLAMEASP